MDRPQSAWFSDRLDSEKSRRRRRRLWALAFNGLFLFLFGNIFIGFWSVLGFPLLIGALGAIYLRIRGHKRLLDPLAQIAVERGVRTGFPAQVTIRRHGIFLGRDTGWLGQRGGALVFEGRRTRFEVIRSDLREVPARQGPPATTLLLRSDQGPIDLELSPIGEDRRPLENLMKSLSPWPAERKELPGPPITPAPRSLMDWRPAVDPYDWKSLVPLLAIGAAVLAEHFPLKVWIVPLAIAYIVGDFLWGFVAARQKDTADLERLAAIDSETHLANERKRIEADPVATATIRA